MGSKNKFFFKNNPKYPLPSAGDVVYITSHGTSVLYGAADEIYTTFSGYLMFAHKNTGTTPAGRKV